MVMRLSATDVMVVAANLLLSGCQTHPTAMEIAGMDEPCSSILQWSKENISKVGTVDILRFGFTSEKIETADGIFVQAICENKRLACELKPYDMTLIKSISTQISRSSPQEIGEAARLCFSGIDDDTPAETLEHGDTPSEPTVGLTKIDQRTILTSWFPWRCQDNSNLEAEGCFGVAILPVADRRIEELIESATLEGLGDRD